jgi:hypothetical protein
MFKINNIIKFAVLGIFLPASIHCMEKENPPTENFSKEFERLMNEPNIPPFQILDVNSLKVTSEGSKNGKAEIASLKRDIANLHQSLGIKKELPTPKTYRALELKSQYKFYQYCDPSQYEKSSNLYKEEEANLAYSQSSSKKMPFAEQPLKNGLKNHIDIEVEQWLTKKENEIARIKTAWESLKSWIDTKPGWSTWGYLTLERIERHVKWEEFIYQSLLFQFACHHGLLAYQPDQRAIMTAFMLGNRQPRILTNEEIKAIELAINVKTPTQFITQARRLRSPAVGTSYVAVGTLELFEGFTIPDNELARHCEELSRRKEALQKEYDIMSDVWLMYKKDFLPKVDGWLQIGSWLSIKSEAEQHRKKFMEDKHPPEVEPTDHELILTAMKRQEKLRKFIAGIRKLPSDSPNKVVQSEEKPQQQSEQNVFARIYRGLDDPSQVETTQKFPLFIGFETSTARRYLNDEERYEIQVMWKSPSNDSLTKLNPNQIALYLKPDINGNEKLYCKTKDMGIEFIVADHNSELANRLKFAVLENRAPFAEDRRELLSLLIKNKYITQNVEPFTLPNGTEMATELPEFAHVQEHRKAWNEKQEIKNANGEVIKSASVFDQLNWYKEGALDNLKNRPVLKATMKNDVDYGALYNKLFQEYQALFTNYITVLESMYQPYSTGKSRIPRGWKFFIAETYEKPFRLKTVLKTSKKIAILELKQTALQALEQIASLEKTKIEQQKLQLTDKIQSIETEIKKFELIIQQSLQRVAQLELKQSTLQEFKKTEQLKTVGTSLKELSTIIPAEMDTSDCGITDHNLDIKDKINVFCLLFRCPDVNLSQNSLTGCLCYPFSNLRRLNLSQNRLTALSFLSGLNMLEDLNLQGNLLSDLSVLYVNRDNQFATLTGLNLSDNKIKDASLLEKLKGLIKLNLSRNDITGPWKNVLPKDLTNLVELELRGNPNLNVETANGFGSSHFLALAFQEFYPSLKTIGTDLGAVEDINTQNHAITLRMRSIKDQNIVIDNHSHVLKAKVMKDKALTETYHNILANTELDLAGNELTGNIPFSSFCCIRIVKLDIARNRLTQIGFIAGLSSLKYLDISENDVDDISSLQSCTLLTYLNLSNNNVRTLFPLKDCKRLVTLKANNNHLPSLMVETNVLPTGLNSVEVLEVEGNDLGNNGWSAFKSSFPNVKTVKNNRGEMGISTGHDLEG